MSWRKLIENHYRELWATEGKVCQFTSGPIDQLPTDFSILEYAPHGDREMWTYATCCMSQHDDECPTELHMFSPRRCAELVELLVVTAHYHRTAAKLGLWHTVNFGRPWLDSSECGYGLVSLPYLDGPRLENLTALGKLIKFYWLIPISRSEVSFLKKNGIEALEQAFEQASFNYVDPRRKSVV